MRRSQRPFLLLDYLMLRSQLFGAMIIQPRALCFNAGASPLSGPNENVVLDIVDQNTLFDNDSRKNTIDHEKIQSSESEQTNKLYLEVTPATLRDDNTYRGFYGLANAIAKKNYNDLHQIEGEITVTFMVSLCPTDLEANGFNKRFLTKKFMPANTGDMGFLMQNLEGKNISGIYSTSQVGARLL